MRRMSCPPCTWWGSRGLQTWRGSECRAGAVCRHSSCGAHPLLGHKSYVSKKKLSTTTTTHTRAHIAHLNFKRWRDTRDHTASWPREAFANEAGLTHASSPPAPRTVCPSSETASSLLAEKFRKANYLASTVRQSASMSISFRLQLHYSERKYCCWQSAVPLPSAQVRLWQLALSPSTLYMYKSTLHSNGSRRITNKRSLWFMESDTRLDQKSVEALEIGLRLNLGLT